MKDIRTKFIQIIWHGICKCCGEGLNIGATQQLKGVFMASVLTMLGSSSTAQQLEKLNVAAGNLASSSVAGFKSLVHATKGVTTTTPINGHTVTYPSDSVLYRDFREGNFVFTKNPYNVAIRNDEGSFFTIKDPTTDQTYYTRNGQFQLNAQRQLITMNGEQVLGEGGPITLPNRADAVTITGDGTITYSLDNNENGSSGKLKIMRFEKEDLQSLIPAGDGARFIASENIEAKPSLKHTILSNGYEASNTNTIEQMVALIKASQHVSTVTSRQDDHQQVIAAELQTIKV